MLNIVDEALDTGRVETELEEVSWNQALKYKVSINNSRYKTRFQFFTEVS